MQEQIPSEIVIVRRRPAWEDGDDHHGVWKIAYADFMTAMMAFFLVMWLVNVTDESVRRGVAQYFNPVKLASTAPHQKGLNDPDLLGVTSKEGSNQDRGDLAPSAGTTEDIGSARQLEKPAAAEGSKTGESGEFQSTYSETQLFTDPYAVLDSLAGRVVMADADEPLPAAIGTGLDKEAGAQGGEAYRDPFDPLYWQFAPNRGISTANRSEPMLPVRQSNDLARADADLSFERPSADVATQTGSSPEGRSVSSVAAPIAGGLDAATGSGQLAKIGVRDGSSMPGERETQPPATTTEEIRLALEDTAGTALAATAARVDVSRTEAGVLVSLTDDQNFGMFALGSSEPRPELVALLERIGKVLASKSGQIVIKGHTDSIPFRSKAYDNWRLSSARAHMALYMLSRGGVNPARFDRVEGYADRDLKDPANPKSAVNRRIEILLREEEA